MPITQQRIHSMSVKQLKNIVDLEEISFEPHSVTAILGPNGNGKSTILHALACAFSPSNSGENYKFSWFFLPNTDALWDGSELSIVHSYRDGQEEKLNVNREYKKTGDRWKPRYVNRPFRDIYYIGIDKCIPLIESEKKQTRINYSTKLIEEKIIKTILNKASIILNKNYSSYNIHEASGKEFIGVTVDELRYSALSMSAGEQKVFYILEKIFKAEKYSLILIDELDLLLHDQALKKLIQIISDRAAEKNLQIIFTTHRESVISLEKIINVRHIVNRPQKTLCFNETKPDAINRLTGQQLRPIDIFVEDDLALSIVKKISSELKITRYVNIIRYGAAINCFTTAAGIILGGQSIENSIFVLDGDVYRSENDKISRISQVLTGNGNEADKNRESALSVIKQLTLPNDFKPEKYLHSLISCMQHSDNEEHNEIIEIAKEIIIADEDHKYINDIIDRLNWGRSVGLSKIVDLVATTSAWQTYTSEIRNWLEPHVEQLREESPSQNELCIS